MAQALPLRGIEDPSGLTITGGTLYAVSDKVDDTIYAIDIREAEAVALPAISLTNHDSPAALDFEGITHDERHFYIVSEKRSTVRRYDRQGTLLGEQRLLPPVGSRFFSTGGAGPEGIALLGDGTLIVTSEREPAGLLVGREDGTARQLDVDPVYPRVSSRPTDATGLWHEGDLLLCLARNADAIACIRLDQEDFPVVGRLDFSLHKASYRYSDDRYGTTEGIAADERLIYVVTDNNRLLRHASPNDRRPVLLLLTRPSCLSAGKRPSEERHGGRSQDQSR